MKNRVKGKWGQNYDYAEYAVEMSAGSELY
jgi:hypothetical protein